jgi:hypothetical protein
MILALIIILIIVKRKVLLSNSLKKANQWNSFGESSDHLGFPEKNHGVIVNFDKNLNYIGQPTCCYDQFDLKNDEVIVFCKCKHMYHVECYAKWVAVKENAYKCMGCENASGDLENK